MKSFSTLLIALLANLTFAQDSFTEAFNSAERSSKQNVSIALADDQNNQTHIPIVIIKGNAEGPVFTIVAGVHGYEYPPIIATQEILKDIDPSQLTGTLIVVPIANIAAFYGRSPFVNPQDQINLNRAFPGDKNGTITEQIANFITTSIIPVTDVFLDIHGGDASEDLLSFVCYYNNEGNPKETALAKRLAEKSGFDYVVSYPYTIKKTDRAKYAFKQAVQDGKTALSIESGKLGNVQAEAVAHIKKGVLNMLNEMDMYEQEQSTPNAVTRLDNQAYIKSHTRGIFYSNFKASDTIKKGEVIGYIQNEFGEVLEEFTSSQSGIVLYKIGTPPVNTNETVMCIGYE